MSMVYCGMGMFAGRVIDFVCAKNKGRIKRRKMANRQSNEIDLRDRSGIIEQYVMELRQLQYIIQNCHYIINSLVKRPDLQEMHAQETMPLIDDYNNLITALREILIDHFEWEHANDKPKNFSFWKLYYELDKEDLFY